MAMSQDALHVHALKHTSNLIRGAVAPDPNEALRQAYKELEGQHLTVTEVRHIIDMTLGNVVAIVANMVPDGMPRQHLISRLEAVASYAELMSVVNNISGPTNRAARRKKGQRK